MTKPRRGTMLVELAVAGALLGALLAVCLQLTAAGATQRRAADQRQAALVELGNVMERIAARPWTDLKPKTLAAEKISPACAAQLRGAELTIDVAAPASDPNAKRLTVSLRWHDRAGRPVMPIRVTTWRWKEAMQNAK